MAETNQTITRSTSDTSLKSFDVTPSAAGPTRIPAERGVRYEFQDLGIKSQGPTNLRAQRVGKDLRISLGSGAQVDVVIEGFYDPIIMGDSPASIYGRGPDGLLYEYVPQASGLTGVTAALVDGAPPVSQVMSVSAVAGVPAVAAASGATQVGALLPVAAAFSPLTAVLIGVGVAAAASGGGGGGAGAGAGTTLPQPTMATPTLALTTDSFGAGTTGTTSDVLTNNAALTFSAAAVDVTREYKIGAGVWTSSYVAPTTSGDYTVQVRDTNKAGTVKTASLSFTLDNTLDGPTLALTTDNFGAGTTGTATDSLTNSAALTFSPAASDVTREYKIGNGAWTSTYTAPTTTGDYTVEVRDTDKAGNVKTASLSFSLDTTVDMATLSLVTGVGNGATYEEAISPDGVVKVRGEIGSRIMVTLTDHFGHTVSRSFTATGTAQIVNLTDSELGDGVGKLSNGAITVSAVATDIAGNTSSSGTSNFTLDTSGPAIPFLALGSGVTNGATSAEVQAAAVSVNGEAGSSIAISFSDINGHVITKTVTGTGSPQPVSLLETDLGNDENQLTDGEITVIAVATDKAGNHSNVSVPAKFTLDTSADKGLETRLVVQDTLVNNAEKTAVSYTVAGLDSDATGLMIFTDGKHLVMGNISANGTQTIDLSSLSDGQITSSLQITDTAGNTVMRTGSSFTIDTSADKDVVATLVQSDATVNNTEKTAVSFTVAGLDSDATGVVTFTDGTNVVSFNLSGDDTFPVDLSRLADGEITTSFEITDTAGNTVTRTGSSFTLETSADKGAVATLVQADTLVNNYEKTVVTYTVADLDSDATGVVTFTDGTTTVTASVSADGTATADLSGFTDGAVTSSLVITDAAGNTLTRAGSSFTLDTSADKDTVATLVQADTLVNNTEKTAVSFTVAELDSDATGLVTFTDGTDNVTATVSADGTATVNLNGLTDGVITSSLAITDTAGNTVTRGGSTFTMDTSADKGAVATLVQADTRVNNTEKTALTYTVAGLDSDATGVVTFTDGTTKVTAAVSADGAATANLSSLTDGAISSSLAITDTAGNTVTKAGSGFNLDTSADKGAVATLVQSDALVNNAEKTAVTYAVAGLDIDASGVVTFTDGTNTVTANVTADGTSTANLSGLTDGAITSSLAITDTAGNTVTRAGSGFNLDTSADNGTTATLVQADATVNSTEKTAVSFTLAGLDSDATGVVTFTDGTNTVTANVTSDGTATANLSGLADGVITSSLAITDTAGNTVTRGGNSFTLDTSADKGTTVSLVQSDTLVNNTEKSAVSLTVAGLDSDATAVVTVTDGTTILTANVGMNGSGMANLSSLADGVINSSLAITDAAGNTVKRTGSTFTLDTSADKGAVATLVQSDALVNNTEKTAVTYAVADLDSDATAVVTFTDGTNTVTANMSANGTATANLSGLADGVITSSLAITDTAGNTITRGGSSFTMDTSADKGTTATLVQSDALVNNIEKTAVSFAVADLDSDATAVVTFTDGTNTVTANMSANGTATANLSGLTDGPITSSLAITDTAGNTVTRAGSGFTLDTSADKGTTATLVQADATVNNTEKTAVTYTVAGLDSDASGVVTFTDGTNTVTAAVSVNGTATANLSGLADGAITSSLAITDTAGNTVTRAGSGFNLDTSADKGTTSTLVQADATVNNTEKTAVTYTVAGLDSDATGVVTFTNGMTSVTVNVSANGTQSVNLGSLSDGTIISSLVITDTAGNTATRAGSTFTMDTSADKVATATLVQSDALVNNTEKAAVTYTVAGLDSDATAVVTFTDGTNSVTANVSGNGTTTANLSGLIDGPITSSLAITDAAGNAVTRAGSGFNLDTGADKVATTTLVQSDATVNNTEKSAVTFTVADLDSDATGVVTFKNGPTTVTVNVSTNGTQSINLSSLMDGTITSSLVITDAAGNTVTRTGSTFTLDTSADTGTAASLVQPDPVVGSTEITAVSFTVAELDSDATGVVTFTDGTTDLTFVVAADGSSTVDLSALSGGTINSTLAITDAAGNVVTKVGNSFTYDPLVLMAMPTQEPTFELTSTVPGDASAPMKLNLLGSAMSIDLADFTAVHDHISEVNISGSGANTLKLNLNDVLIGSPNHQLQVTGDADDAVTLTQAEWTKDPTSTVINGHTFDTYTGASATHLYLDPLVAVHYV